MSINLILLYFLLQSRVGQTFDQAPSARPSNGEISKKQDIKYEGFSLNRSSTLPGK